MMAVADERVRMTALPSQAERAPEKLQPEPVRALMEVAHLLAAASGS